MTGASSVFDLLALIATTATIVGLVVAGLVLGYRYSLKRHPYVYCRRCNGTGARRSRIYAHSFGICPNCDGSGHRLRLGARLLNVR
ncbi:hypothetical protein [Nonomuraea typhae]|uniref:hypothetical protein n=1 Tax=Nonomuraea typhae TaxID=2603600 RepID=UPI0012FAB666|nr:hypothetical protein [Nonomuraea typhae]